MHGDDDGFKVCTCGTAYTLAEWRGLPRCGEIVDVEKTYPAGPGESLIPPIELRTCKHCGSTVSKRVPYQGGTDYPPRTPPSDG